MEKKNYGKSVRTHLVNLMNETGYKYMYLLARYFNERLLYRVSVSQYKDNFLLKGGSLLYALDGLEARPTVDIDFMADRISRDRDNMTEIFRKIVAIGCDEDGVYFDTESIKPEPITVDKKYPGLRFYVTAHMDTIVHNMSVDIGFGDVVSPCPMTIDFPLLLPNIPSVNLQAYSLETVVAEKFHAMIDRDETNSRMKDFFDCYMLFTQRNISDETLFEAIKATFDNRVLAYKPNLKLFSDGFATDKERIIRWKAFLKKIQWKEEIPFPVVMQIIKDRLQPMVLKYWGKL
ncbi:MAG: nucleotidyl transferase AbiEii/AbiGii toxin family protein [Clostridiales bacterium]|jgi:predicted nucleotidyltransferase component of viral defense system|nr:MAG: nucleotidyl transferase AbiEii/AbiGii toxin family protein [Clostridiales bacterium]